MIIHAPARTQRSVAKAVLYVQSKEQHTMNQLNNCAKGCAGLRQQYPFPDIRPNLIDHVSGWNTKKNLDVFEMLIRPDFKVIVELGCWVGQSSLEFLRLAPTAQILCVDHWLGSPEHLTHEYYRRFLPSLYSRFVVNTWAYRDRVTPIKETTIAGLRIIAEAGIEPDFIYIDASHEFEDVRADIRSSRRLFPKATIAGDDYDWDPVRDAIADLGFGETVKNNGVCWWL